MAERRLGRFPERELVPYEASRFSARSVLVLAPHPDDEVFGCGAALASLRADGVEVHVLIISDGAGDEADPARRKEIEAKRTAESALALSRLGGASVETTGLPDRNVFANLEGAEQAILRAAAARRPDLVFAPSPVEVHPDHRAVSAALARACGRGRKVPGAAVLRSARIAFYEISQAIRPNFLLDATLFVEAKERAVEAFVSQLGDHDYPAFVRGLSAYRRMTLPREVIAAEGYYVLPGRELALRGPEGVAPSLGPSRPPGRRQPLCIQWGWEAVMRLKSLFFVLFVSLVAALAFAPAAAAGPHGGHHGGGGWGGGWGWGGYGGWGWGWGGPWWGPTVIYAPGYSPGAQGHARFAAVDTDVSPEEARVYLDGTYIGTADDFDGAPGYLFLLPGRYKLEFRHPLYETIALDLDVHRGEKVKVDREMKLLAGKHKLDAFDPAEKGTPYGRYFGPRAAPVDPRARAERDARKRARSDDDYGIDARVDPDGEKAEAPVRPRAERSAIRPKLSWKVSPDDASVYLDDRFLGSAEDLNARNGTRIPPGKHTVTVIRPGYQTRSVEVEAKEGAALTVAVALEK